MQPEDQQDAGQPGIPEAISPGGAVRFNVSDGQLRSATWLVFTKKNKNDVYAAARQVAGHIKISLHESGWWQHGFVSDDKANGFRLPEQRRQFAVWRQPAELVPGWTRAAQIVVPDASLQDRDPPSATEKPVLDIFAAGPGDTTIVEIWLESPQPHQPLNLDGSRAVARLRQPNATVVWLVARRFTLPWDPYQRFGEYVRAAHDATIEQQPDWTGSERFSICVHDPDHPTPDLILWELAVTALVRKNSYWRFAPERMRTFHQRAAGTPGPWTNNPVLAPHKFTNVYQAADPVSQYLIRDVIYTGPQDLGEVVFRVRCSSASTASRRGSCCERASRGDAVVGEVPLRRLRSRPR